MPPNPPSPALSLEDKEIEWDTSLTKYSDCLAQQFGEWQVRQDIYYLDHGAFGGCPKVVAQKQRDIRQWMEENPHEFFERNYVSSWKASRTALADFINVDAADLVLLPGATHGMNVVIQSLQFQQDDEIITTNHAYSSVKLALEHVARRDNARLVIVDIPLHVSGPDEVLDRILANVTAQTRFAVIDHVPSRSGMIFPIKKIVAELAHFQVDTLVDGAHAPGMIPLDVSEINAAYYVANCHKWMCAPRGTGFLHVRPNHADRIKPLVIGRSPYVVNKTSHSSLEHNFGWMGTNCPSAMLTLPTCIDFLRNVVPGGYNNLIGRNHEMAVLARRIVCAALGISVPCPDHMIGAMATIPLPDSVGFEQEGMLPIQQALWREHAIVIPVYSWPSYPKRVIRFSVQAYNTMDQYHHLAKVLHLVLRNEKELGSKNFISYDLSPPLTPEMSNSVKNVSMDVRPTVSNEITRLVGNQTAEMIERDTTNHGPSLLISLAEARIRKIVHGEFALNPIALYPSAGNLSPQFARTCSLKTGSQLSLEVHRITHMLALVGRRRIPQVMAQNIAQLMATNDILENWNNHIQALQNQAHVIIRAIVCEMAAPPTPAEFPSNDQSFVCKVVPYETEKSDKNLSLEFWQQSLASFIRSPWSYSRIELFLQIHAFLKDPVAGLRQSFKTQTKIFISLFNKLKPDLQEKDISETTWEEVAAQLALESSFASQPLARQTSHVYFSGDQQLAYSYSDINLLARSEFADPQIVIGMVKDILTTCVDECAIAPVTAAHCHSIFSSHDARAVIVDGNNRITTICFLRFIAIHGVPKVSETESVGEYCRDYGLGPILAVDLCAVLRTLWQVRADIVALLNSSSEKLQRFKSVRQVPVLVTEESSFFTKEVLPDGSENVLQPVHQYIFATDDVLVALPSKTQSHGRSNGFKALPIR